MTGQELQYLTPQEQHGMITQAIRNYAFQMQELELLRREIRNWSTLYEIGKTLSSILDLDVLLNRVADFALEITGGDRAFMVLSKPNGGMEFRTARERGGLTPSGKEFKISKSIAAEVLKTGRTVAISNVPSDSEFAIQESVISLGIQSVLCAPLIHKGNILGALYVDSFGEAQSFQSGTRETLEALAAQAAIALENANLLEEVEHQTIQREKSERLAALGTMSAGVAHEIRNPLGIISNAVYFLRSTEETPDLVRDEQFEIIFQEIHRANRIIDDLLAFARIRAPEKQQIDLNLLLTETVARCEQTGKFSSGCATLKLPKRNLITVVDPDQLRQVFFNILDNAGRYIQPDGKIDIRLRRRPGKIIITFANNGSPISGETLPRIFEPFVSGRKDGSGLGLAVASTIISLHGGEISAENLPLGGCRFTIQLPESRRTFSK